MSSNVILILAAFFCVAAVILLYIFIIPHKKRDKLNSFGKFIHDTCNFKYLTIEKILKFLYVISTTFIIMLGFFMIFWVETTYYYNSGYKYAYSTYYEWRGYIGFVVLLVGPIFVRIIYEVTMMIIIAINNIIEINNKLPKADVATNELASNALSNNQSPAKNDYEINFCATCGTCLDDTHKCPQCMKQY